MFHHSHEQTTEIGGSCRVVSACSSFTTSFLHPACFEAKLYALFSRMHDATEKFIQAFCIIFFAIFWHGMNAFSPVDR